MNLQEARATLPHLEGLDDDQVVDAIHMAYYADLPREQVAKQLGVTPKEPPAPPRTFWGTVADTGLSALKGAIGVPEAAVGLADIVTGGRAGKALEEVGFRPGEAKKMLDEAYSPAQKAANEQVQKAEGLWNTFKAAVSNPSTIGHSIVESLPLMGAGGLAGRGMVAAAGGRIGAGMAGALGEGIASAGSAAEQIRQETKDGLLTGDQPRLAVATGAATSLFGMLGARVAKSLGIADVDTMLAGAAVNPKVAKGITRQVLEGAVSEGLLEELPQSVMEQVLQNIALDRPLDYQVSQAAVLGTLSGAAMGGGANLAGALRKPAEPEKKPRDIIAAPDVDTAIDAFQKSVKMPEMPGGVAAAEVSSAAARMEKSLTGTDPAALLGVPSLGGADTNASMITAARSNLEDRRADDYIAGMREDANRELQSVRERPVRQLPHMDAIIEPGDRIGPAGAPLSEVAANETASAIGGITIPVQGGWIVRPRTKPGAPDEANPDALGGSKSADQPAVSTATAGQSAGAPGAVAPGGMPAGTGVAPRGGDAGLDVAPTGLADQGGRGAGASDAGAQVGQGEAAGLGGVGGLDGRGDANGDAAAEVDGWKRFPPEMRSLDVPRADMPQIKAEHRGAMVNFLNARGIEHSEELDVSPGTLRPTQAEYSPAKIEQARAFTGGNRAILVSADNRILDGHHQWAQALQDDKPIRIIRLKAPITQLLNTVKEFPSATTDDSSAAAASPSPAPAPDVGPGAAAADAADGRAGEIGPSGGPVAADAEGTPSADVAPPAAGQGSDVGARWDRMTPGERRVLLTQNTKAKGKAIDRVSAQPWDALEPGWQKTVARVMPKADAAPAAEESVGPKAPLPVPEEAFVELMNESVGEDEDPYDDLFKPADKMVDATIADFVQKQDDGQRDELDSEMQGYEDRAGIEGWWGVGGARGQKDSLLAPGRVQALQAIGVSNQRAGYGKDGDLTKVLWNYLPTDIQEKLVALRKGGWTPKEDAAAPAPTAAPAPAARPQPGDPSYTLLDARNDLIEMRQREANQGRVVDDRLSEQIRRQVALVRDMEKEQANADAKAFGERANRPAPAPTAAPKPDPLTEQEKAAKAKMLGAAAKLAQLLSKNTRMNITPEQEQAMLPIVIELFEGAMDLGYVKFKQAARYVRKFIADAIDQDAADAIPLDTLQGAYIATARRHQDKAITPKGEVVMTEMDEVLGEDEAPSDTAKAQNGKPEQQEPEDPADEPLFGANDHDTARDGAGDDQLLDGELPPSGAGDGQGATDGTGDGLRPADAQGDGRPEGNWTGRGDGLDGGAEPVLSGPAAEPEHPAEIRPLADGPLSPEHGDRPQPLAGENPGNFIITDDLGLGEGTDGKKIEANLEALRTLRRVQAEHRYPTPEEQAKMARYVGWGGLKNVFDTNRKDSTDQFGRAQRELKTLLSPGEYNDAAASVLNAHYTSKGVVDAMWRVARFMGFKGGRALEPTVGVGNFLGLQPQDMAASTEWHASELDSVTGQLAQMLYPEANILAATGFQDAPFADGVFDLAIGNPPFGPETIRDKTARRKHLSGMKVHNYIIAKTGMHLRPGGVMAMVVTHRFLDTANPEARAELAKSFRFLGAFRLPNDAFAKNAGTEVVTDVVFLQKLRPGEKPDMNAAWLDVNGRIDGDIRVNRYYQENPGNLLGRSAMDGTMYGGGEEYTLHGDGRDLGQAIDALMAEGGTLANLKDVLELTDADRDLAPAMLTQSDIPVGGVLLDDDGKIIRREMDDAAGNAVLTEITPESLWKDQAEEWMALRDAAVALKEAEAAGRAGPDEFSEVVALSEFLYASNGEQKSDPSKAQKAVYTLVDDLNRPGVFQWRHDDVLEQIEKTLESKRLGEGSYNTLKAMLNLRNRMLALVQAERADDTKRMELLRAQLNAAYDKFVKEHGFLSEPKNANLLDGDVGAESGLESSYTPAISAEVAQKTGQPKRKASATKADILTRRVNFPHRTIDKADTAADALFASLTERGRVDLGYMAKITGKSVMEVVAELTRGENPRLFLDPEAGDAGEYQEAERYLSGNVRHKLEVARKRRLEANIKALEAVQPAPKTKAQIKPNIRGMWMPESVFAEFLGAIGYRSVDVKAIPSQGILTASGNLSSLTEFGIQFRHDRKTPLEMFNAAVAGKPLKVYDPTPDGPRLNDTATKEVGAMVERMGKVFAEWAYSTEERAQAIVDAFNERMNTHVARQWDGEKYLKPVGINPSIPLRRTQKNGAWRIMQATTTLLDHVVGAGKTYTIITGVMERRRMRLSRKPMIAVPNHLVTQWARDFYRLYPGARVLAATPKDFAKKNRRRLLARIATGDYDAIIVGHSSLGFIENPPEDQTGIIDEKLSELRAALAVLKASKDKSDKRTVSQIERRIKRYEDKLQELSERNVDEIGIDFKAMGVDFLAVDEAHEFKNLEYSTSGERVVGMNDPNGSKKAFDLYVKIRGLLGRKGAVTFATGTPVSNSLVEIYTVMSYLAHEELKLRQQQHFDAWSGAYAATETRLEYTATQKLKPRRVLAGLNNLSALRQLYEQFADIITMADLKRIYSEEKKEANAKRAAARKNNDAEALERLGAADERVEFPVPKVKGGKRQLAAGEITPAQREYMDYLVARMVAIEASRGDKEYAKIDNPLFVLTDARKMSLDIRIVDPTLPRDPEGKVARAAANIKQTYDDWNEDRGTQMVFCDLSTPAKAAVKDAKKIIAATVEKLYSGKRDVAAAKNRMQGLTFEQQWRMLSERADDIVDDETIAEEKRDAIQEYMDSLEDVEAVMLTADIGFSVYDDMKALLVEKGIPEKEIAFIHDYNTPEQKAKLFDMMNNGYIRVLMGSSQKMGAGTNAQARLVALHHMDAPWRPSDVEQREGRIIRQGNIFYARDPDGFEVDIKAYSTNSTSDTVMWQILQRKAGAIEQFREGGIDSVEEEGGDSDQYAEFMASSTGNPVFRLKLEAERRLTELEAEVSGALITRGNARSFLERYPQEKEQLEGAIAFAKGFDVSTVSYGGQSGTLAEHQKVMEKAMADYDAAYAEFLVAKDVYAAAVEAIEALPEEERKKAKKPAKPVQPARPNLLSKEVQKDSAYARVIASALADAKPDRSVVLKYAGGSLTLEGNRSGDDVTWWLGTRIPGSNSLYTVARSAAKTAANSDLILQSLDPRELAREFDAMARYRQEDLERLNARKKQSEAYADREVNTSARDAAAEELGWYKAQVAFAETQADIDRASRPNRFIARDKKRPLSSGNNVKMRDPVSLDIGGNKYQTTGLFGSRSFGGIPLEATDEGGNPAVVFEVTRYEKDAKAPSFNYEVMPEPAKVRRERLKRERELASRRDYQGAMGLGNDADVVFSQDGARSSLPADSRRVGQMQQIVDTITGEWARSPIVTVVRSISSPAVPQAIRDEAARRLARGGRTPRGVIYQGKVWLFADAIGSDRQAAEVLFHEVLGHYGMRGHFGAEFDAHLEKVQMLRRPDVDAFLKRTGLKDTPENRRKAAEEVLAHLAQTKPELSLVQRALAIIRNWLRENLPTLFGDISLSDADLIEKFILPARRYVEGPGGPGGGLDVEPAFASQEPPFYSALQRGVQGVPAKAQPPAGWVGAIKALVNKGAVKPDEVEWSGVMEWLGMQQGKVSKEAVLAYLDQNGVQVQEVTLGGSRRMFKVLDRNGAFDQAFESRAEADAAADAIGGEVREGELDAKYMGAATKYSNYTLPGGTNYREVLLTLPVSAKDAWVDRAGNVRTWIDAEPSAEVVRAMEASGLRRQKMPLTDAAGTYKSGHWTEPNVLAHIRLNDRTDAQGRRVMLIEEIQSDFAQDYRKQKDAIKKAVDDDFAGIIDRMKKAGVLEVRCD